MGIGLAFVLAGLAAVVISYALRSLFVNRGDEENPYRRLSVAVGAVGLVAAAWGVVVLVVYEP